MTEGMERTLENLTRGREGGGGVKGSGNPEGRGSSEVTFNFIDVLIALIDKFAKNCYALSYSPSFILL